jgi:diketogulonate reductase-like aldo/keto reductase
MEGFKMSNAPTVKLNNGIMMPQLGLGVWLSEEGPQVETAVTTALQNGYRLIDTAAMYGNEAGVGRAIKASGVKREEIFLTTKLMNTDQGYDNALKAFEVSRKKLDTDYIDLYLIHWPMPKIDKFIDTWKAFEKLYADKKVRAIGVSNFTIANLEKLMANTSIVPAVNQIELHPQFAQHELREYCKAHGIQVESYSPLMHGGNIINDDKIKQIADKHHKTNAQIILRWHMQNGLVAIPKSVRPDRIIENINIFDFQLDDGDMKTIDAINIDERIGLNPDDLNQY